MNNLTVTEYKDIRVLTTQQIAEAYEAEPQIITNNFNRNKDRYKEGKHYICLTGNELREFRAKNQNDVLPNANKFYLWTEKGAFLHAKSLNTGVAWEVYEKLVDSYFAGEEKVKPMSVSEQIHLIAQGYTGLEQKMDNLGQKVENLENTMNIDYAQQKQLKNFAAEVVVAALGGKDSRAYRYRYEDGRKLSSQAFSRFWHDFNDYFNINAYANLPRARFIEALEYINRWQPPTNMQLEIGRINRMQD
ncbi:MAG TPA: hypothetical protein DCZ40_12170 [Lachnospiraceae bacterium]|nr:hypothetical protein [Lachnospiraceae bacterium]